jgi:glycosyltransferase involved in cell wall biosynthesis
MTLNLKHEDPLFYYILQTDISEDNGPGVNEWEFINSLLDAYPENFIIFAPRPSQDSASARKHLRVHYVASHRGRHPVFYVIFLLHQLWMIFRTAFQRYPSAIVTRPGPLPIVPLIASYLLRVPLFLKIAGLGITTLRERWFPLGKYILYPLDRILYSLLLRRGRLVETVTQNIADWHLKRSHADAGKFVVIPNAVNTSTFCHTAKEDARQRLGLTQFQRIVGYVGRVREHNGVLELVEGAKLLSEEHSEIGFVIVGDGKMKERLEDMVVKNGLSDQFVFTGQVAYQRIPQYINAFDIGIALFPTWWMERSGSSSQKIRQYLSCQRPVLASMGQGHNFIEENQLGWLVVPEDSAQVAESIIAACSTHPEQLESMGRRGREYVIHNFSISNLTRRRYEMWISSLKPV